MLSCQNAPISSTENILDSSGVAPMPIANDLGIELNNGKKWLVDSAMMVYLRAMENDILLAASMGEIDYKGLSQKLQSTADRLTSNCTMKGKAHDELHKWLLPYLDRLEELSKAMDEKIAAANLEKMKQSYLVFNQFFYKRAASNLPINGLFLMCHQILIAATKMLASNKAFMSR